MVWVRNFFLNYEDGGETPFLFVGRGRNVFPKYELGAKRLTKKWCELTMGRKVCVPFKKGRCRVLMRGRLYFNGRQHELMFNK